MANWVTPECDEPLMQVIGRRFAQMDNDDPQFFPNLRQDRGIVIAGDYSGEHQNSDYQIVTFVLADRPAVLRWNDERIRIRKTYSLGGRRHAFKKLADAQRQKALIPFLKASSDINGLVFCAAIDNSLLSSSFGYRFSFASLFKPHVQAKLIRIAVLGSMLVGGLSAPGQDLKWLTDDDEIVANDNQAGEVTNIIRTMLNRFCPHGLSDRSIGVASKFDDGLLAEDLCSIPDLVGGALSESWNSLDRDALPRSTNLYTPILKRLSTKAEIIEGWLASLRGPLKKVLCLIRPGSDQNQVLFSFASPSVGMPEQTAFQLWRPPDKGWIKSSRAW